MNTVEWSECARWLVSGSDDLCAQVYTGDGALAARLRTGHRRNVFCAMFLPGSSAARLATTAADGQVRLVNVERAAMPWQRARAPGTPAPPPPQQQTPASVQLFAGRGSGMGMKLAFLPAATAHCFLSTHEDGLVRLFDTRAPVGEAAAPPPVVVDLSSKGAASDVCFEPGGAYRFAVGCADPFVRLYDLRMVSSSSGGNAPAGSAALAAQLAPASLLRAAAAAPRGRFARRLDGVSGLAWGARPGRLYASYRGADVYCLETHAAKPSSLTLLAPADDSAAADAEAPTLAGAVGRYRGRRNERTFLKGLALVADGAYVAAGGDCGSLHLWHAASGALAARVRCDGSVLNAVAPHPHGLPVLAVSGIDDDVKMVAPGDERAHAWRAPRTPAEHEATAEAMRRDADSVSDTEEDNDGGPGGGGGHVAFGQAELEELLLADGATAQELLARIRDLVAAHAAAGGDFDDDESDDESGEGDDDEEGSSEDGEEGSDEEEGDAPSSSEEEEEAGAGATPRRRTRSEARVGDAALDGMAPERSPRQRRDG